jgi:ABC-type nitrate/sulfonate/bicarbonate transport system substrate-binding protein
MRITSALAAVLLLGLLLGSPATTHADDRLKIAAGGRGNWDSSPSQLGQMAGIFKKHGLDLEILFTAGGGETLQTVISGAVDIGVAVATSSAMAAYAKGAPIRVIGSLVTGTGDTYYYVRTDSSLKSLKDATETTTIAYSTAGSSTNLFTLGLIKTYGIKSRATRTGDPQATLTQVMSGQVDVGYATAPFALSQILDGQIRVIARADEIPGTEDQTVRVILVNANKLAKDREVVERYMKAYAETVDWIYSSPDALKFFHDYSGTPEPIAKKGMTEFYKKEMLDPFRVSGLDAVMQDAVTLKLLQAPLSKEQLAELFQVKGPR